MSSSEIQERIENEKSMLQKLKMNHSVSTLENPLKIKFARKVIARLYTELNNRDRAETSTTATVETVEKTASEEEAPKEVTENAEQSAE